MQFQAGLGQKPQNFSNIFIALKNFFLRGFWAPSQRLPIFRTRRFQHELSWALMT